MSLELYEQGKRGKDEAGKAGAVRAGSMCKITDQDFTVRGNVS